MPTSLLLPAWFFLVALAGCADASASIAVDGRAALIAAIERAKGGETLSLAPGSYGAVSIQGRAFAKPLTLISANPSRPATLTVFVKRSSNIIFRKLSMGRALRAGEPDYTQLNNLDGARNITFDGVHFHGSLDGDASNDAWGLYTVSSEGVTITRSSFEQLARAFVFDRSRKIEVSRNRFRHIRSDGGDFAAVDDVLIDGNHYTDFQPAKGDHPDAIQFWTNGQTRGSSNIRIVNNQVLQGSGAGPQGIFIRDEVGGLPFRNVTIENNLLYSMDQWEGISVEGADGLVIANNSVLSDPRDEKTLWIRVDKARNARISGNVVDRIVEGANQRLVKDANTEVAGASSARGLGLKLKAGPAASWRDLVTQDRGYKPPSE